jgi:MbtH protein
LLDEAERGVRMSEELKQFMVLNSDEGKYSIWLSNKEIPCGWRASGKGGTKEECLSYVRNVWTDMRPISLRAAMGSLCSRR